MSSQKYHKVSEETTSISKGLHTPGGSSKNSNGPKIHQEYEYFQLFDPDDSDIEDEADPDVRSLLVSRITTTYTTFSETAEKRCCVCSWYIRLCLLKMKWK